MIPTSLIIAIAVLFLSFEINDSKPQVHSFSSKNFDLELSWLVLGQRLVKYVIGPIISAVVSNL